MDPATDHVHELYKFLEYSFPVIQRMTCLAKQLPEISQTLCCLHRFSTNLAVVIVAYGGRQAKCENGEEIFESLHTRNSLSAQQRRPCRAVRLCGGLTEVSQNVRAASKSIHSPEQMQTFGGEKCFFRAIAGIGCSRPDMATFSRNRCSAGRDSKTGSTKFCSDSVPNMVPEFQRNSKRLLGSHRLHKTLSRSLKAHSRFKGHCDHFGLFERVDLFSRNARKCSERSSCY